MPQSDSNCRQIPVHVAIIMDGNGRWAAAHGLPRTSGHRQGAEAVRRAVEASIELGIGHLTLFGFSSENWKRPESEIRDLMSLLERYLRSEIAELHKNNVRLRIIGDRTVFAPDVAKLMSEGEALTRSNNRLNLTIALNYGGRADIVQAVRRAAEEVRLGRLDPSDITEERFAGWLLSEGLPDPDLLIRTSGEQRISNFLLWQSAYTEFVFLDILWPDFSKRDLESAITEFGRRERRYGASGA
ncbi:MAG: isoprenyl transferase [Alphaproteobacteria bacterium]|nr:isoprenyl transferase [Alphaproteobacteria bacterium]